MKTTGRMITRWWHVLAALIVALGLGGHPIEGWAAVDCANIRDPLTDSDNDGFTDAQECSGITTIGGATFPRCVAGLARDQCVDPDSKDLFVIFAPASSGSLLTALPNPFRNV